MPVVTMQTSLATPEEFTELGEMFKKYLEERFKDNIDKLEKIWKIDPINVIPNMDNPLRTNGYHPALILHFHNFCKNELAKA